jgi:hypothetical protein
MRTSSRNFSLLATAALIGLCTASAASAANIVPNPSFEADCSGVPCGWFGPGNTGLATATRDTAPGTAHIGEASYLVTSWYGEITIQSDCFAAGVLPGQNTYDLSYWYETTDSNITGVKAIAFFYSASDCNSGASAVDPGFTSPVADGQWHQVSAIQSSFTGSDQAARIWLTIDCGNQPVGQCATGPVTIRFDDMFLQPRAPTAVRVTAISATRASAGVVVKWQTASERVLLGFNVYRQQHGKLVKLNRPLIPSVFGGMASGHAYSWIDRRAPREAARYRLQAVSLSGGKSWVGSATVGR